MSASGSLLPDGGHDFHDLFRIRPVNGFGQLLQKRIDRRAGFGGNRFGRIAGSGLLQRSNRFENLVQGGCHVGDQPLQPSGFHHRGKIAAGIFQRLRRPVQFSGTNVGGTSLQAMRQLGYPLRIVDGKGLS